MRSVFFNIGEYIQPSFPLCLVIISSVIILLRILSQSLLSPLSPKPRKRASSFRPFPLVTVENIFFIIVTKIV